MAPGIPINPVQYWLGHAQLSKTATNAGAVEPEEHQIVEQMWRAQGFTTPVFLATVVKPSEVIKNAYDISF